MPSPATTGPPSAIRAAEAPSGHSHKRSLRTIRRAFGWAWCDRCSHHSGPWNTKRWTSVMTGSESTRVAAATPSVVSMRDDYAVRLGAAIACCGAGRRTVPPGTSRRLRLELVHRVECRDLVALRERRVVEHRVDEVVEPALEDQHRLADVDQLGRSVADGMHADEAAVVAPEDELQHADVVADDRAARDLAVERAPDLVPDRVARELFLVAADHRHLGNRVDPERRARRARQDRSAEGVQRGDPALLHRGRREAREPDHVADGVDVRHRGPEELVHVEAPALVRAETGRFEVQVARRADSSGGV